MANKRNKNSSSAKNAKKNKVDNSATYQDIQEVNKDLPTIESDDERKQRLLALFTSMSDEKISAFINSSIPADINSNSTAKDTNSNDNLLLNSVESPIINDSQPGDVSNNNSIPVNENSNVILEAMPPLDFDYLSYCDRPKSGPTMKQVRIQKFKFVEFAGKFRDVPFGTWAKDDSVLANLNFESLCEAITHLAKQYTFRLIGPKNEYEDSPFFDSIRLHEFTGAAASKFPRLLDKFDLLSEGQDTPFDSFAAILYERIYRRLNDKKIKLKKKEKEEQKRKLTEANCLIRKDTHEDQDDEDD